MSKGLICDHCGTVLELNDRGDAENGENAAWLLISTGTFGTSWDACSRSCAVQLIEEGPIGVVLDAELEVISDIARVIREDREGGHDDE
jgi:hypothetical protein